MNTREKVVIRILLLVAGFMASSEWNSEIKSLAAHISVNLKDTPDKEA